MLEENVDRKKPKRILLDVSEKFHKELRKAAAECGVTMSRYVQQAISKRFKDEGRI